MARASSDLVVLSDRQVEDYAEQGFLSLDRITSEEEVTSLREIYDRLFEPGALVADHDRVELAGTAERSLPQILNPDDYAPELLQTEAYRSASAVARRLLGEQSEHMGMHAIRKSPRSVVETPWHQDEAYWDPAYLHRALSIWIPDEPRHALIMAFRAPPVWEGTRSFPWQPAAWYE